MGKLRKAMKLDILGLFNVISILVACCGSVVSAETPPIIIKVLPKFFEQDSRLTKCATGLQVLLQQQWLAILHPRHSLRRFLHVELNGDD
jgi:hypothetical protein